MSRFDSEVIRLVCDADFVTSNSWAMGFRDATIEEIINRYKVDNDYDLDADEKFKFAEGDLFLIDGKEYRLRLINKHNACWLEPVVIRNNIHCVTGGLNKTYHIDELENLEYLYIRCY